jgi:3-phenylpropionate/cinnamic acid dioxygenase small subunit
MQAKQLAPEDRQAITDLILRFYRLVDQGRADETVALFTETARLTFGPGAPKPGTTEGAAIGALMVARASQVNVTTRHVLSNIALSLREDGAVEGYSLLTLYRSETDGRDSYPASVADIDELFVRGADGWRIQARTISPIFNRA